MPSTATEEVLEETPQTEEEEEGQEEEPIEEAKAVAKPVQRKHRGPNKPKAPQNPANEESHEARRRQIGEDFFDYLQRIAPEDWSNSRTSGLYFYKKSPKGNVRITDEPAHGPITLAEFREQFYPTHGDGNYRLQFTTSLKYLTSCGENVTFDSNGASLGAGPMGSLSGTPVSAGVAGFADAIKATSEMLKDGAKAAVDVSRLQQVEHNKPVDIAGIITAVVGAITAVQPKNDGDSALIKLLEGQRKDAEERAKAAKEEADIRERRAKEDAAAARERDQQFFTMMQKQSEGMNAILLKQAESKSDSLTQMTNLITSFMTVREKIEDSLGGSQPKGWEGVIGNAIDKAGDILPHIMSRFGGGAPQQQPQMIQGPQGPIPQSQEQQEFPEMVNRIGKYLGRDVNLWDGSYLVRLIETEYPVTHAQLINQPKEAALQAIASLPIGEAILKHEAAAKLINDVLDVIKNPDLFDTVFPEEEPEPEQDEPPPGPQRRKANGRIHREKGSEGG